MADRRDEEVGKMASQDQAQQQGTTRVNVQGATAGYVDVPTSSSGGGGGAVDAGAGNASVSYPWLLQPQGYGILYSDDRNPTYFRNIPAGFNDILKICPGAWPPGYRVPNGQVGGGYPPSGSQAQGTEPILITPPPRGTGRLTFVCLAKIVVTNPDNSRKGTFAAGLGVGNVNGPSRPMFPYLGAAHDLDINAYRQETIGPGETRSHFMHRADFIDNTMDGGSANFPTWPTWEVTPNANNKMFPALAIAFKNGGQVGLQVGNIFCFGMVL